MKTVRFVLALFALSLIAPWQSAKAADVICYNCPPEWADWASMLKAIKADLNYDIPHDNKNSGQALAQILAEKNNPVGDIGYFGVTFGMKAKAQDALEPYKPAKWDEVPAGLKDADGYWTTIHSGTLGLFVNKDALGGKPVPTCWKVLLKPDYKGMVGYLDPSSAAVGYVGAVAINLALGGSATNLDPAINFFKELRKNDPIVPKQTSYARVVSGEMPILFDYDFNAYRAKYSEKVNFEFVIPCEGSVVFPYVVGLVAQGPLGLAGYLAVLTEPRYRATLINTVVLAAATTIVTLVVATIAGMFLQRHRFPGRAVLIAMLTFPLAFPGVVVGFMIILLAGRQGLIGDFSNRLFGEKLVFAYLIYGLFLGYLYVSILHVIHII